MRERARCAPLPVLAELLAHDAAHLAERTAVLQRRAHRLEQVARAAARLAQLGEPRLDGVLVALLLEGLEPLDLLALRLRVDPEDLDLVHLVGHVLVDADDDVLLLAIALLVAPCGLLDLGPDERDALDRAAHLVDAVDQRLRRLLDLVGERLDEVGAGERIDGVGRSRLVGEDLLGAKRDARGGFARQRERLVEAVRMQRLGAAAHRREALQRHAHDVVVRLLGGERDAARLGVEADLQ